MRELVLSCINQNTTFELLSFSDFKDIIGDENFENGSRDFDDARQFAITRLTLDLKMKNEKWGGLG